MFNPILYLAGLSETNLEVERPSFAEGIKATKVIELKALAEHNMQINFLSYSIQLVSLTHPASYVWYLMKPLLLL